MFLWIVANYLYPKISKDSVVSLDFYPNWCPIWLMPKHYILINTWRTLATALAPSWPHGHHTSASYDDPPWSCLTVELMISRLITDILLFVRRGHILAIWDWLEMIWPVSSGSWVRNPIFVVSVIRLPERIEFKTKLAGTYNMLLVTVNPRFPVDIRSRHQKKNQIICWYSHLFPKYPTYNIYVSTESFSTWSPRYPIPYRYPLLSPGLRSAARSNAFLTQSSSVGARNGFVGWFISWKILRKWMIWGYSHAGNLPLNIEEMIFQWFVSMISYELVGKIELRWRGHDSFYF